jgi:L-ribulose-5-phosphate 3-epimerase
MSFNSSRRGFLAGLGSVVAVSAAPIRKASSLSRSEKASSAPVFQLSVLTDEISQDLGRALEVAAREFGLGWVELREIWKKNILRLDAKEVGEVRRLLERYKLRVSAIASPFFKVDWPGAPLSKFSPKRDEFSADFTFEQQDDVLERSLELARVFNTPNVRIFDFWRIDDQKPYRAAMDAKLRAAAEKAGKRKITLVLENEGACNTATSAESARTLAAVRSPFFKLNWDPGNAAFSGDNAYPDGYARLPKDRIGHVHCKDLARKADGTFEWAAMGRGIIDYVGQFRALKRDGYRGPVVLETHWRGAGTPEESSRQCWAGMKEQLRKAEAL